MQFPIEILPGVQLLNKARSEIIKQNKRVTPVAFYAEKETLTKNSCLPKPLLPVKKAENKESKEVSEKRQLIDIYV